MTALAAACAPPDGPSLSFVASKSSFDGRSERLGLRVSALEGEVLAGSGLVELSAPVGRFVEGDSLELREGQGNVTYQCDPVAQPACSGTVRLGATWRGLSAIVSVTVLPSTRDAPFQWRVVPTFAPVELRAAETVQGQVWAVGDEGTLLALRSGRWEKLEVPTRVALHAVLAAPDGAAYLLGAGTTLVRFKSGRFDVLVGDGADDFLAGAVTPQGVLAVTSGGRAVLWDGLAFGAVVADPARRPLRAAVLREGGAWVAGESGLFHAPSVATAEELSFTAQALPAAATWTALRVDPGGVWLGGDRPVLGGTRGVVLLGPTPEWSGGALDLSRVNALHWAAGSDERFALSDEALWRKFGGGAWTSVPVPIGGRALATTPAGEQVLVGAPGVSLVRVR